VTNEDKERLMVSDPGGAAMGRLVDAVTLYDQRNEKNKQAIIAHARRIKALELADKRQLEWNHDQEDADEKRNAAIKALEDWREAIDPEDTKPEHKPCPKCGGECIGVNRYGDFRQVTGFAVGCIACPWPDGKGSVFNTVSEAWAAHDGWTAEDLARDYAPGGDLDPDPPSECPVCGGIPGLLGNRELEHEPWCTEERRQDRDKARLWDEHAKYMQSCGVADAIAERARGVDGQPLEWPDVQSAVSYIVNGPEGGE